SAFAELFDIDHAFAWNCISKQLQYLANGCRAVLQFKVFWEFA
ncbi:MAG: hypothetical protein ACI9G1_005735, partial [Pirellulaceae bacterium]